MKIERTKNASRNVLFGTLLRLYQIVVPFFMRTAMIHFLGVQYLGLNGLFTSILQVLSIAELGAGSAMVFSMYKPIAEDDTTTICALLKMYRTYYRRIGLAIAIGGMAVLPFVPQLVKGEIPSELNIYVLYLLNLAATVLTYWVFAYKSSLFTAHQRNDVTSKISLGLNSIQYLIQVLILVFWRNYYLYLIVLLIFQICSNIVTAFVATRMYPLYTPQGVLSPEVTKDINQRIKDLFTAKIGGTLAHSADTLVISAFLGLSALAVYQNYYYIMNSVLGMVLLVFTSCTAGIGNSLFLESEEKNYFDFKRLAFLTIWISAVCVSCFLCVYQPFMKLWVGEEYLLDIKMVILFCIYFYLYLIQQLSCVYKDAAGIWHQDRYRPLIVGLVNLLMNVLLVRSIGLYGVLLSTILSYLVVAMPWVIYNIFKFVFKRSSAEYIVFLLKGTGVIALIAAVCYWVCSKLIFDGIVQILCNLVICILCSILLLLIIYRRDEMYNPLIDLCDNVSKNKFHNLFNILKFKEK